MVTASKSRLIIGAFIATFALTGCTSADSQGVGGAGIGLGGSDTAISAAPVDMAPVDMANMGKAIAGAEFVSNTQQSVIRTGGLTLTTSNVTEVYEKAQVVISEFNGRIENSTFDVGSSNYGPTGYLTARIPEAKFDAALEALSGLAKQSTVSVSSADVTLQTIDLEAKLKALTTSKDRLVELLEQASTTSDLIAAEQALAARQSEIDSYQSQLDYLSSQVAESTLTIQIVDDSTSITQGLRGIKETMLQTAKSFLQAFENVVIFIGTAIPWIIVFSILLVTGRAITRLIRRRQ
jgi:hypothetical protein